MNFNWFDHNCEKRDDDIKAWFPFTANSTTMTQKQIDYVVEQSFFPLIGCFDSKLVVVVVEIGFMETRLKSSFKGKSFNPLDGQLKEKFNQRLKLCVTAKVRVLELWNNNIEQLEDDILKFDTSFGTIERISLKTKKLF